MKVLFPKLRRSKIIVNSIRGYLWSRSICWDAMDFGIKIVNCFLWKLILEVFFRSIVVNECIDIWIVVHFPTTLVSLMLVPTMVYEQMGFPRFVLWSIDCSYSVVRITIRNDIDFFFDI